MYLYWEATQVEYIHDNETVSKSELSWIGLFENIVLIFQVLNIILNVSWFIIP